MRKPSIQTIALWLKNTAKQLSAASIPSARLDAELILAHVLNKPRTWLLAHDEVNISEKDQVDLNLIVKRRLNREPIAYILGIKDFYGREFIVTPDVLIPRPETEAMIDLLKEVAGLGSWEIRNGKSEMVNGMSILDVGTGSGALAITAALELPSAKVYASDISPAALSIAKKNSQKLLADVTFFEADLLSPISHFPTPNRHIILANLPYVDRSWQRSPETDHEPDVALFADDGGLKLIYRLIKQSTNVLTDDGYLILEADPEQHQSIIKYAQSHGFELIKQLDYALALKH